MSQDARACLTIFFCDNTAYRLAHKAKPPKTAAPSGAAYEEPSRNTLKKGRMFLDGISDIAEFGLTFEFLLITAAPLARDFPLRSFYLVKHLEIIHVAHSCEGENTFMEGTCFSIFATCIGVCVVFLLVFFSCLSLSLFSLLLHSLSLCVHVCVCVCVCVLCLCVLCVCECVGWERGKNRLNLFMILYIITCDILVQVQVLYTNTIQI